MLSKIKINQIKSILDETVRPIYFFDDDPDGLCSFILFYKYVGDGQGIPVKSSPKLGYEYSKKVESYSPDRVIVLDKPKVAQEFFDEVSTPILWVDHHEIQKPNSNYLVNYFNSRTKKDGYGEPTSYCCYSVTQENLWIAMVGCVGDWFLPEEKLIKQFQEQYPDLLVSNKSNIIDSPEKALYETKVGELVRIFSFLLKGSIKDIKKNIRILTRVKTPYEVLDATTSQGQFLKKYYIAREKEYLVLLNSALKKVDKTNLLLYNYDENQNSYTADLSNELLYRYPKKVIIIARVKSGEMRMSLRSASFDLPPLIEKALDGLQGYGGGHIHACGCSIAQNDFPEFIERFKKLIS